MSKERAFLRGKGMRNRKDLKFRRKYGSGGFTIVEVCVAVAILAVLLSVGFVALAKRQKELRVQEMDNLAREAYMAAENRALDLARARTLVKAVGDADGKLLKGVTYKDKNGTTRSPEADASVKDLADDAGLDSDVLTSPVLAYVKMPTADSDLIKMGSIESKITSGCVYLVYDLFSGTVVDAYYAAKDTSDDTSWSKLGLGGNIAAILTALYTASPVRNFPSVADRASEGAFVGRYAISTSADSANRNPAPDVVNNVSVAINNGDNLSVEIAYPGEEDLKLDIKISYKTNVKNLTILKEEDFDYSKNDVSSGTIIKKGTLILDGDPSVADSRRFCNLFENPVKFDGSKFTVEVKASKPGYRDSETIVEQGQPLFAEESTADTAIIKNLRHLQNLDSAFSGTERIVSVIQKANIDAKGNIDGVGEIGEGTGDYEFKAIYNETVKSYISLNNSAITNLNIGSNYTGAGGSYKGLFGYVNDGFSFTGVTVNGLRSQIGGILNGAAIAGGLVGGVQEGGSVSFSNCAINNADVKSESKNGTAIAGGMVGRADKAYFKSCVIGKDGVVKVWSVKPTDVVSADDKDNRFAGGMAGCATSELKADDCHLVKADVKSEGYRAIAGGLVGDAPDSTELANCTVGNYAYRKSDGSTENVDGDVTVLSSSGSEMQYSDPDAWQGDSDTGTLMLGGTGGMIGYARGIKKFDSCGAEGKIAITGTGVSDQAGGLIGFFVAVDGKTLELKSCNVQKAGGEYFNVKSGEGNAGGMVGYVHVIDTSNFKMTDCTADSVAVKKENASYEACAGGLVGYAKRGELSGCTARNARVEAAYVDASGVKSYAGGIVGRAYNINFSNCRVYWDKNKLPFTSSNVSSQIIGYHAGGLAGGLDAATDREITASFAATFIKGCYSGGLLGYVAGASNITISRSYADNVLGGNVEGGLVGYSGCKGIIISDAYAVVDSADWGKFDNTVADLYIGGLFGNKDNGSTLNADRVYGSFYGNGLSDRSVYSGENATYTTNCFRVSGNYGYSGYPNGVLPGENPGTKTDMAVVIASLGGQFTGPSERHPYLLPESESYPYRGLAGMPHYGDWGKDSIDIIEAATLDFKDASGSVSVQVRALKKSDTELAGVDGDVAITAINNKLNNCIFEHGGKSYKFKNVKELSFAQYDSQTDYSRASLSFTAEWHESGVSKGLVFVNLSCDSEGNGGIRTEASLERAKAMITSAATIAAFGEVDGATNDARKDNALEKVRAKLKENNLGIDLSPKDPWSDYDGLFDITDASLTMDSANKSKSKLKFKLKKNAASMEKDAITTDYIEIMFQNSVNIIKPDMLQKTDWGITAELTEIGDDKGKDKYNIAPGALAEKATGWLHGQGFTGYSVAAVDGAFRTSNDKGYAEASFRFKKGEADYGDTFTLKTPLSAAPSVVAEYLKKSDKKLPLNIYAMANPTPMTPPPDKIEYLSPNAQVQEKDREDFKNALVEVLQTLNSSRGLGGYSLTFVPDPKPEPLPNPEPEIFPLRTETVTAEGGKETIWASMKFKVAKSGYNDATGELKVEVYVLTGFASDVEKQLKDKSSGKTLASKSITDGDTAGIQNIQNWAAEKLIRIGYPGVTAAVKEIADVAEGGNILDVKLELTFPTGTGDTKETKEVTVKAGYAPPAVTQ